MMHFRTIKGQTQKHVVPKIYCNFGIIEGLERSDIPPKQDDFGRPEIECKIRDVVVDGALIDTGASCNLLPFSTYKELGQGRVIAEAT